MALTQKRPSDDQGTSRSKPSLESTLRQPGEHVVQTPIICVITRFELRSAWGLVPAYLGYRRIMRDALQVGTPGLLRTAFLVENPVTFYSLSIWANRADIPRFGTNVPAHVAVARKMFGRIALSSSRGPAIWSTKWNLASVSNNLTWKDFDLRGLIVCMETERKGHV